MKVCLISPHFPPMSYPCGAADFTKGLALSLSAENDVHVLTANEKAVQPDGISLQIFSGPWNILRVFKMASWIRKQSFDVIDIQFEAYMYGRRGAILLLPLLLPKRTKKILTLHSEALPARGGRLWRVVQMKLYDHMIFYSEQFMKNSLARFKSAEVRSSLSPFPANIARNPDSILKNLVQKHFKGVGHHQLYLSYFGHIAEQRGIEFLLSTLEGIKGKGVHFVFIGQFDPGKNNYHRDLLSLIREKGLEETITFTGRLDEKQVSEVISFSDFGVLPFTEGASFKNGSLAAYATHNVPVITTEGPTTEKALKDNAGIVFYKSGDVLDLQKKIVSMLSNPSETEKMKSDLRRLEDIYSWEGYSSKRNAIYQNVSKNSLHS